MSSDREVLGLICSYLISLEPGGNLVPDLLAGTWRQRSAFESKIVVFWCKGVYGSGG